MNLQIGTYSIIAVPSGYLNLVIEFQWGLIGDEVFEGSSNILSSMPNVRVL